MYIRSLTSYSLRSYSLSDLMSAAHSSIAWKSFQVVRQNREREKAKLYTLNKARNGDMANRHSVWKFHKRIKTFSEISATCRSQGTRGKRKCEGKTCKQYQLAVLLKQYSCCKKTLCNISHLQDHSYTTTFRQNIHLKI